MRRPRWWVTVVLLIGWTGVQPTSVALVQDQNNPEALRRELAESGAQLKAAQDRKNELANENEKLKQQIAAMQKQLDDLNRVASQHAEQSYALRSRSAAMDAFLSGDSRLRARFEVFLESVGPEMPRDFSEWPISIPIPASLMIPATQPNEVAPTTQPTDAPTTAPTTQPS